MRARIVGLAIVAVAVLAALLWLRTPDPRDAAGLHPRDATEETSAVVRPEAEPNGTPARTEAVASEAALPQDGIPVDVFAGDGDAPVAGAQVFSIEWGESSSSHAALLYAERGLLLEHLETHGVATRTDANGRAIVPRSLADSIVFARLGATLALTDYVPADERIVLRLEPTRTIEVHVASESGADAAGVEVVLLSKLYFGRQFHATTDEHGLARFRAVQPFEGFERDEATEITTRGLFVDRPSANYASFEAIPPRVELTLPPCGSVEIELMERNGVPVDRPSEFQLLMRDGSSFNFAFGGIETTSPTGRLRIPWVEVDSDFEVTAGIPGSQDFVRQSARGPTVPGETVKLSLRLGDPAAEVYRAVDEQGRVLAKRALTYVVRDQANEWDDQADPYPELKTETDDGGRFRLPLPDRLAIDLDSDGKRTVDVFAAPGEDGIERQFRAEMRTVDQENDVEGGDALFLPASILVAGQVVDEAGAAVAGALVLVSTCESEQAAEEPGKDAPEALAWALSDSTGRFVIRGCVEPNRFSVFATDAERRSQRHDVDRGAADLVLTLPLRGALVGSLLLPPGTRASFLYVEWTREDTPPEEPPERRAQAVPAADPAVAHFRLDALRVGRGTFRVSVDGREVTRIDRVDVLPTKLTRDPRLQRIDLCGLVRPLRVLVDLPSGQMAYSGQVHVRPSLEHLEFDLRRPGRPIRNGVAECLAPTGPVDVRVETRGLRVACALGVVASETRIRLRPGFDVSIEFRAPVVLEDVSAYCRSRASQWVPYLSVQSTATGQIANTQVGAAGPWIVWMTTRRSGTEFVIGEWTIDVADTDAPQRFVLDVDPRRIEESRR